MKNLFKKTINKGLLKSLYVPEEGVLPFFKEYAESQPVLGCAFESPIYEYLEFISTEFDNYKMLYKYGERSFEEYIKKSFRTTPDLPINPAFIKVDSPTGADIDRNALIKFAEYLNKEFSEDSTFTLDEVLTEISTYITMLDDTTGEEDDNED